MEAYYFIFPQYFKPLNSQFYENVGNKQHDSIGIDTENLAQSAILKLKMIRFEKIGSKKLELRRRRQNWVDYIITIIG